MRPSGGFIVGAPPYSPPGLTGPRPGTTGVSIDPATGMPSAYTHGTGSIGLSYGQHRANPVAIPYGALIVGYRVNRAIGGPDAQCHLDVALCRMRSFDEAPGPLELIADSLATVTWDALDTLSVDTPVTLCAAPAPIAPGWYWIAYKAWRSGGITNISALSGPQLGAAMSRVQQSVGVGETERLVDVLDRANTMIASSGVTSPVNHLVLA